MTRRTGWWPAFLVVLATNAFAMGLWYWNRSVPGGVVVELAEGQAWVSYGGPEEEVLQLNLNHRPVMPPPEERLWADSTRLVDLGFSPWQFAAPEAGVLNPRRRPLRRPAWVLLAVEPVGMPPDAGLPRRHALIPVAVGADPEALYRESGDRARHLVLRGVVALRTGAAPATDSLRAWHADLDLVTPARLHVPQSLVPVLRELSRGMEPASGARFTIRLRTGRLHLPWVVGVVPGSGE